MALDRPNCVVCGKPTRVWISGTPCHGSCAPQSPANAEDVAMNDELFRAHDCRKYNLRTDGKTPETADDCEVCWLANK